MEFSHHFWGMHPFWWLFWIIVLAALLMWGSPLRRSDSPLELLRRRYAAGEISDEEYRHRVALLTEPEAGGSKTAAPPTEHHG